MEDLITRTKHVASSVWWAVVFSGAIGILFGVASLLSPEVILNLFVYAFAAFAIVMSLIALAQSVTNVRLDPLWWLSSLIALCGISVGVYIMFNPTLMHSFLGILLAVFIFMQALLDLIMASYAEASTDKTVTVFMGIAGLLAGFIVLLQPQLAAQATVWVIGAYILVHGVIIEIYAFRIRDDIKTLFQSDTAKSKRSAKAVEAKVRPAKSKKRHE